MQQIQEREEELQQLSVKQYSTLNQDWTAKLSLAVIKENEQASEITTLQEVGRKLQTEVKVLQRELDVCEEERPIAIQTAVQETTARLKTEASTKLKTTTRQYEKKLTQQQQAV